MCCGLSIAGYSVSIQLMSSVWLLSACAQPANGGPSWRMLCADPKGRAHLTDMSSKMCQWCNQLQQTETRISSPASGSLASAAPGQVHRGTNLAPKEAPDMQSKSPNAVRPHFQRSRGLWSREKFASTVHVSRNTPMRGSELEHHETAGDV